MIRNRNNKKLEENHLPSSLDLHTFGNAMSQLDLSDIPMEKRPYAIRAHFLKIMAMTMDDRQLGSEIASSYLRHFTHKAAAQ